MSKSAFGQMTRSLAEEWGRYGVRVNALAAGFILTDLTRKLWEDPGMQEWGTARRPLRFGWRGAIFGHSGLFFCDGQILYVDGGFTAGLGVTDSGAGCLSVGSDGAAGFDSWQAGKIQGTCRGKG